jgi:hypothetical protein
MQKSETLSAHENNVEQRQWPRRQSGLRIPRLEIFIRKAKPNWISKIMDTNTDNATTGNTTNTGRDKDKISPLFSL